MKIKAIVLLIALLVLYMIIPMGEYGINDVDNIILNNKSSSMRMPAKDFISKVEDVINPETSSVVIPLTTVARDGKEYPLSTRINSGMYYFSGGSHGALDIVTTGKNPKAQCKFSSICNDTALIAPFSGTVVHINYKGDDANYFNFYKKSGGYSSIVRIAGEGLWEGYSADIVHFTGINPNIKKGDRIEQGDFIGFYCSQGNSTAPHLHYSMRQGSAKIKNPGVYMDNLVWHSSIKDTVIRDGLKVPSSSGFTTEQFNNLQNRPRYESTVVIPDKYKTN